MSLTHVHSLSTLVESTGQLGSITVAGATRISVNRDSTKGGTIVPIGTNTHITDVPITVADVQSFRMQSDQDMTVKTNSSGSPDDTIALKANMPYIWIVNKSYDTFKLTVDVVSLYLTNTVAANFSVEALVGAP